MIRQTEMSHIICGWCGTELRAFIPLEELRQDATNLGWRGSICPDCLTTEELEARQ